jgi:CheY-like chemotaxis protein
MSFPYSRMASDMEAHPALIRTLVLDDSAYDRTRIRRLGARLDLPMEFAEADSVRGLGPLLDRQSYDLILVDYEMPEADGLQALDLIRGHAAQGNAAAIMISGHAGTRVAVSALKRGCQDFIPKADMSREVLRPAILQALATKRQALREAIPHDPGLQQPGAPPDEVSALRRHAFDSPDMQDVLRKPLEVDLLRAAEAVGLHWGKPHYDEVARFIETFQQEDEFVFLRN